MHGRLAAARRAHDGDHAACPEPSSDTTLTNRIGFSLHVGKANLSHPRTRLRRSDKLSRRVRNRQLGRFDRPRPCRRAYARRSSIPNRAEAISLRSVVNLSATPIMTTVSTAPDASACTQVGLTAMIMLTTSICTLAPERISPRALHHRPRDRPLSAVLRNYPQAPHSRHPHGRRAGLAWHRANSTIARGDAPARRNPLTRFLFRRMPVKRAEEGNRIGHGNASCMHSNLPAPKPHGSTEHDCGGSDVFQQAGQHKEQRPVRSRSFPA